MISNIYKLCYQDINNKIEKETLQSYLLTQGAMIADNMITDN